MAAKLMMIVFAAATFASLTMAFPPPTEYKSFGEHHDDGHFEHHAPAPYHFEYGVKDPHTNDIKSHHETSDGHGNVKGSYSLVEADGSTRVVEYTADHEGFNAKVKKIEAPHYAAPAEHVYHEPLHAYKPTLEHKFF